MDFSEIIIAIIIGLVILAINASGAKKKQTTKNQSRTPHNRIPESREFTPQEAEESTWNEPRPLTIDDIFKELRRAKEEAEQEEDDYIPKAPRKEKSANPEKPAEKKNEPVKPTPVLEIIPPAFAQATAGMPQPATQPLKYNNEPDENVIDIQDIDWRKAVIVSEILNRKY